MNAAVRNLLFNIDSIHKQFTMIAEMETSEYYSFFIEKYPEHFERYISLGGLTNKISFDVVHIMQMDTLRMLNEKIKELQNLVWKYL